MHKLTIPFPHGFYQLIDTLFKHGTIYKRTQHREIVPCLSVISIRSLGLLLSITGCLLFLTSTAFAQGTDTAQTDTVTEPGVLIVSVRPESAAQNAGLQRGNIILRVGDTTVDDAAALRTAIRALEPGTTVTLTLLSGEAERTITVTLGELDGNAFLGVIPYMTPPSPADITIEMPRPPVLRDRWPSQPFLRPRDRIFAPQQTMSVTLTISEVMSDSPAADVGLQVDDQITAINSEPITNPRALINQVRALAPGDTITLTVQRAADEPLRIPVTLGATPDDAKLAYLGIRFGISMAFEAEMDGPTGQRPPMRLRLFMPRFDERGPLRFPRLDEQSPEQHSQQFYRWRDEQGGAPGDGPLRWRFEGNQRPTGPGTVIIHRGDLWSGGMVEEQVMEELDLPLGQPSDVTIDIPPSIEFFEHTVIEDAI